MKWMEMGLNFLNLDFHFVFNSLLKPWEEYGSEMRVWQNDAQIMMGVLNGTNLHIHELLVSLPHVA